MLDYAQSFEEFSSSLKPVDLALYAGAAIVLWVLFKDKLSPVQKLVNDLLSKVRGAIKPSSVVESSQPTDVAVVSKDNDIFFDLVVSWKQTRDLAVKSGCDEAVKVADQMFPYLSPNVCGEGK